MENPGDSFVVSDAMLDPKGTNFVLLFCLDIRLHFGTIITYDGSAYDDDEPVAILGQQFLSIVLERERTALLGIVPKLCCVGAPPIQL
jgi:hypothetical protein